MSLINSKPTPASPDRGSSIKSNDAVGSGSRPTPSKVQIETSEPANCHTQGRAPSGYLK